jgi:polyisoprenoid-binding protein YceI
MKALPLLFAALLYGPLALAADYQVEKGSTLGFTGTFQGESFEGRFSRFEAQIRYDSTNIESSLFDVTVDLASVSTGDADRDDMLPDAEFFDVSQFPKAHFVTRQFRQSGDQVIAEGTLTMKGVSKPVDLAVEFESRDAGGTLDISTSIERLDFGVGSGEYADTSTIGNEVKIKAHLVLGAKL